MPGSRYDRFVRTAKIVLPLAALAVMLVTLIWPLSATQEFSFILDKKQVETSKERLRMERPVYRGEDRRGQAFEITARQAVQRTSSTPIVELAGIDAVLAMKAGDARVSAASGRYDLETEKLRVSGPVKLRRSDGYSLDTQDVTIDLPTRTVRSDGAVAGKMPLGQFTASQFSADVAGRVVVLDGGAHLRIEQRRGR